MDQDCPSSFATEAPMLGLLDLLFFTTSAALALTENFRELPAALAAFASALTTFVADGALLARFEAGVTPARGVSRCEAGTGST